MGVLFCIKLTVRLFMNFAEESECASSDPFGRERLCGFDSMIKSI